VAQVCGASRATAFLKEKMKAKWPNSWLVQCVVLQLVLLLSAPSLTQSSAVIVSKGAFLSAGLSTASAREETEEESKKQSDSPKIWPAKIWPDKLAMSVSLGLFIAVTWITLLASTPVVIHVLDGRPVTRTGMCLAVCVWIALFGGLYVFTNVVQFSSPHFERVRSLTIIECIYFMAQILTTVGYGDIVPAYFRGRVFVCIYAVCSFLIIAELLAEMFSIVSSYVDRYEQGLKNRMTPRPTKPSLMPCIHSLGVFTVIAIIFVCTFHYMPGEEKDWLTAVYMSVITMSTVGFGAVTPVTERGMAASAFLMVFGALALTRMVIQFSTYMMEHGVWERFNANDFKEQLKDRTHGVKEKVSEVDFLCLTLISNHMVNKGQLQEIRAGFSKMKDPSGAIRLDHLYTSEAPQSDSDLYELPPALHSLPEAGSDGDSNTPELERPPQLEA